MGGKAWKLDCIKQIISKLTDDGAIILGGDILTDNLKYTYDNWHYVEKQHADIISNVKASKVCALDYLCNYENENGSNFYVTVITKK